MEYEHIVHPFQPIYHEHSKILILGSLPSVKSREQNFYYGHRQNRFWKVISELFSESLPKTIDEKRDMLLRHDIAIWDVIYSCDIKGSSDSSIRNVTPTDIASLIRKTQISHIYCNGKMAGKLYAEFQEKNTGIPAVVLPSTSPANAAYSEECLIQEWRRAVVG